MRKRFGLQLVIIKRRLLTCDRQINDVVILFDGFEVIGLLTDD